MHVRLEEEEEEKKIFFARNNIITSYNTNRKAGFRKTPKLVMAVAQ